MPKDPLIKADYINYDGLEAKSVPEEILDQPVTGTGSISALVIIFYYEEGK